MNKQLAILGGGQLGRMLQQAAIPYPCDLHFLDAVKSPIGQVSPFLHQGDFRQKKDVLNFCNEIKPQTLSIEIEDVSIEALFHISEKGEINILPNPQHLATIKDKGLQKQLYEKLQLPTAAFELYQDKAEVKKALQTGQLQYPFVQKLRTGGYDGKGVQIIKNASGMAKCFDAPCLVEVLADIDKELAITILRDKQGHTAHYPIAEMVFNENANLVEYVLAPARINANQTKRIQEIAHKLVDDWNYMGILAIELFLNKDGSIWINEVAPRTHNSGHWTIEACHSSQFDQQIRLMMDLPLGSTAMKVPYAAMINLLGAHDTEKGQAHYHHIDKAYEMPGAQVHLYGKQEVRPYRKMGHISLLDDQLDRLLENAAYLFDSIKINNHE